VKGRSREEEVHEDGAKPSAHGHGGQRPASRNPPARRLWHSSASIPPTLGDAQAVLLPSRAGGASARARGRRPPAKTPRTNLHISIENVGEGSRRSPQLVNVHIWGNRDGKETRAGGLGMGQETWHSGHTTRTAV
jgi:hypothetical protein